MSISLDKPDHTTLSRRGKTLKIKLRAQIQLGPIDLIIDSTGLSVVGEDQSAAAQVGVKMFRVENTFFR